MLDQAQILPASEASRQHAAAAFLRSIVIGLTAFVTVVDLFAAQALLPSLVQHYGVTPGAMSLAVNASTFGMAAGGLGIALFARDADQRLGILTSLVLLSIPTALLAVAPDLAIFTALRVVQGVLMSAAFGLTLAYLGERYSANEAAGAFAAYITGNVASNLFGRMLSAAVADHAGLAASFTVFAGLNLAGALLVYFTVHRVPRMGSVNGEDRDPMASWTAHLKNTQLRAAFAIGFCILFAFIGAFTFVNFVLARPPLSAGMMQLGLVNLVFLPSIVTTPFAGRAVARLGTRPTLWGGLALAALGLPLMLLPDLAGVLAGMTVVAVGTFLAQATATGFVSQAAPSNRGAASGIYLACYFLGGLAGTAILGQIFDQWGWAACVAGIGVSIAAAAILTSRLRADVVSSPR